MKLHHVAVLASSLFLLTACGGGGGGSTIPALPEGVYSGTSTGGPSTNILSLKVDNQESWTLYGTVSGNVFNATGFWQGLSTSSNGSFSASNGRDFGNGSANSSAAPSSGTYTANYTYTATTTYVGPLTITSNASLVSNSLYNYSATPSMADFQRTWTSLTDLQGNNYTITVANNGTFTGSITSGAANGCTFTGSLTPRTTGKNLMTLSLTYGAGPCADPNATYTGVAISYVTGINTHQVLMAAVNAGRTRGYGLIGNAP